MNPRSMINLRYAALKDHLDLVAAFERQDRDAARDIIVPHTEHSKATMRAGIEKAGT